jgi:hypothetical protein
MDMPRLQPRERIGHPAAHGGDPFVIDGMRANARVWADAASLVRGRQGLPIPSEDMPLKSGMLRKVLLQDSLAVRRATPT